MDQYLFGFLYQIGPCIAAFKTSFVFDLDRLADRVSTTPKSWLHILSNHVVL